MQRQRKKINADKDVEKSELLYSADRNVEYWDSKVNLFTSSLTPKHMCQRITCKNVNRYLYARVQGNSIRDN